jgi:hypothetical protein
LIIDINEKLLKASLDQDGAKIQELSKTLSNLEDSNETLFDELEISMAKFEQIEQSYDIKLKEFI